MAQRGGDARRVPRLRRPDCTTMRIALVVPGGVDPPGAPRVIPFIHHLVRTLGSRHQLVVVAVGHDVTAGEWELFGTPVINVPVGRHSKLDVARVLAAVPRAVGRFGRPDVVHALWANLPGLAAVAAARRWRVPSVVSVCGGEFAAHPDIDYGGGLTNGSRRLALAATRGASAVTVATEWMRTHVLAAGAPVHDIVPLGADLLGFSPAPADEAPRRLVHVGSLNRVKDQDLLLHAFALLAAAEPGLRLVIAGGDTLAGHHAALAAQLGIVDRVEFLGHVPHHLLPAVVRGATLHVLTSRHDAGPVAVLEAAACGVPTVGTRVGHVHDLATMPAPAAVVASQRTPAAVAAAVTQVLHDPVRHAQLAAAGLAWARSHDAVHTAASFEMLYRRLLASSASS